MYNLQQVYDYLNAGTVPTIPGSFQEPSAGPGSTMKTTKQIYEAVATPLAQCDATADKVLQGTKFFCTQPGSWGVRTGTLVVPPTPTPTSTPIPETVIIGGLEVASLAEGPGCAGNATMLWSAACSWGTNLAWRGKDDWRLPTKDELSTICANKTSLGSYAQADYWSSTVESPGRVYLVYFIGTLCQVSSDYAEGVYKYPVRAVRTAGMQ